MKKNQVVKGLTGEFRLKFDMKDHAERKMEKLKKEGIRSTLIKNTLASTSSASLTSLNKKNLTSTQQSRKLLCIVGHHTSQDSRIIGHTPKRQLNTVNHDSVNRKRSTM